MKNITALRPVVIGAVVASFSLALTCELENMFLAWFICLVTLIAVAFVNVDAIEAWQRDKMTQGNYTKNRSRKH